MTVPVVTPAEMKAIDEAAPEPVAVLIERAGAAVARVALDMLGGTYGRRVVVVAGKGNNGADGRAGWVRLRRRGVRVGGGRRRRRARPCCPPSDLVVDAADGTGLPGRVQGARPGGGAPVLAVDIPSGVDVVNGKVGAGGVRAERDGDVRGAEAWPRARVGAGSGPGEVAVADIGLDAFGPAPPGGGCRSRRVAAGATARRHKWETAV